MAAGTRPVLDALSAAGADPDMIMRGVSVTTTWLVCIQPEIFT